MSLIEKGLYCKAPWMETLIRTNGDVTFCCHHQESLGNIHEENFKDIWNCTTAQEIRQSVIENKIHLWCEQPSCHFVQEFKKSQILLTPPHLMVVGDVPNVQRLFNVFSYSKGSVDCVHDLGVAQGIILNAYAQTEIPELDYSQKLLNCSKCGKKTVSFRFRWHDLEPVSVFKDSVMEIGNPDGIDFYFPLCYGGQGDFLNQLRFISAFKDRCVGLIMMESYRIWEPLLQYFPFKHIVIVENPKDGDVADRFHRFAAYVALSPYKDKLYSWETVMPYEEYLGNVPTVYIPPLGGYDVIIHRRMGKTRKVSRNIPDALFSGVLTELPHNYKVGIVGIYDEDPVDYPNDLRKFSFDEQLRYVAGAKVIIDTDSVIDKVAEWCGIPSVILQVDEYIKWGSHVRWNGDVVICAPSLELVTVGNVIQAVEMVMGKV